MSDIFQDFYPKRFIDPNEPNLIAGYSFDEGELAQFGRYINRASSGAIYDLTTPVGTPLVGQGGGIDAESLVGSWTRAAIAVGASNFAYVAETENRIVGAVNFLFQSNAHYLGINVAGRARVSFDLGGTWSTAPFDTTGRGPYRVAGLYDGVQQILVVNGTQVDADAVVPLAPLGTLSVGSCNTTRMAKIYNIRHTIEQERASYVKEFASKVLWQWTPRDVGEGPAGGLVTNCTNFGDFFCPLGAATLKFNYVRDRHGRSGLALYDSNVGSNRISFAIPEQKPFFGSWLVEHIITDPATDDSQVSFDTIRNESTSGGSGYSYWIRSHQSGGLWSLEWMRGGVGPLTSVTMPVPVANSRVQILGTRRVDGVFQIHARVFGGRWYSSALSAADTTHLNISYISLLPRGGSIAHARWHQGEMTASELSI